MAIYRMDFDGGALLRLSLGSGLFVSLVFFAGTLVGYSLHPSAPVHSDPGANELAPAGGASFPAAMEEAPLTEAEGASNSLAFSLGPEAPPSEPLSAPAEPLHARAWTGSHDTPWSWDTREDLPSNDFSHFVEAPTGGYALQVGAFRVQGNADALASDLRARGYDPLVRMLQSRSGDWLEHVHLAVFPDEGTALAAADSFMAREHWIAVVVSLPLSSDRPDMRGGHR